MNLEKVIFYFVKFFRKIFSNKQLLISIISVFFNNLDKL